MRVCVAGLWHLGTVTAACLAAAGHRVAAHDPDSEVVANLLAAKPPIFEPGLKELVSAGLASGELMPTGHLADAVRGAEVVWVTYDTPVDDEDQVDSEQVLDRVREFLPLLDPGTVVLVSSQLPVGSIARLEAEAPGVSFACSPENLRLGKAIEVFSNPDRVIVGVRDDHGRERIAQLLSPVTDRVEWMGVESAEMAKHAINSFLATSVTFINEIASVCERVGADAREVERALKTEQRIGPRAYLGPGAAFAGGTLARDVRALTAISDAEGLITPLLDGIWKSNDAHRSWPRRALVTLLSAATDGLAGKTVAVWGLTYKPGTDTLRRSASVGLCRELVAGGAAVRVHDPAVTALPPDLAAVTLAGDALEAATGADAVVLATEWPEYLTLDPDAIVAALSGDLIVDANGFLAAALAADDRIRYATVGRYPR
ncbi:MAG TPA: nucleotide sugar dehydrogenase [Baekduia sp.]|nr:nucleotide sugar dehydrogenase [Baekduia sp.]